jgi:hypothetical protein
MLSNEALITCPLTMQVRAEREGKKQIQASLACQTKSAVELGAS